MSLKVRWADFAIMTVRRIIILTALVALWGTIQCIGSADCSAQRAPAIDLPEKQPPRMELPPKRPSDMDAADGDITTENDAEPETDDNEQVALPQKSGNPNKFQDAADHLGDVESQEPDPQDDLADGGEAAPDGDDEIPPIPTRRALVPPGPPAPPPSWTDEEIKEANAQCKKLLTGDSYDYDNLEPIKDGVCGDPAPILLKGLNATPKITINPPATINCGMADRLNRWMNEVVQPQAQKLLDDKIVRLVNLSGYVCRRRYNSPGQKMSHHAFANALDLGEFITEKGEEISVLKHWPGDDKRAEFLKEIHKGACGIFGTVLGPLANSAHANHFHFDGAKRRHSAYCQ